MNIIKEIADAKDKSTGVLEILEGTGWRCGFDVACIVLFMVPLCLAIYLALLVLETSLLRNREDIITPRFRPWFLPALFVGFVLPPVILGSIIFSTDLINVCFFPRVHEKIKVTFARNEKHKEELQDLLNKNNENKKIRYYEGEGLLTFKGVMTETERVKLTAIFQEKDKIKELFKKSQPLLRGIWVDTKRDYVLEYWFPFFFIAIWIASLYILILIAKRFDPHGYSYLVIRRRGLTAFFKYIGRQHTILFYGGLIFNYAAFLALLVLGPHAEKGPGIAFLFVGAYSISTVWFIPFFNAYLKFNTIVLDDCVRSDLHKTIRNLKGHKVLLGFEALGGNVCKEILKRDPIDSNIPVRRRGRMDRRTPHIQRDELDRDTFLRNRVVLIDPDYEVDRVTKKVRYRKLVYLATDMVVVDDDEKLFDKVFTDPSLEKIGIAKVEYDSIRYDDRENRLVVTKEEIWIPAIIGDVTNESVIDNCALDRCDFFIDTIEGYDESLRVAKFAHDNPVTRGIITVSDSAQKEFLYPRHSGHGIFLVYPTRQRGISLAEVVYPAMINTGKLCPNVLVFTDDLRQTHYMIETILQELKLGDRLPLYPRDLFLYPDAPIGGDVEFVRDLRITICSESDEIKRVCYPKEPRYGTLGLDERRWIEIIERCAVPENAVPQYVRQPTDERYCIQSRAIVEKPHLVTMEKLIRWLEPLVVVISYRDTSDLLKVLHDWVIAVERRNSLLNQGSCILPLQYAPKIAVGYQGEEERDVRDWLQYYDTICRNANPSWEQYPRQAIDCLADLNKDSKERIAAIVDAWRYRREV